MRSQQKVYDAPTILLLCVRVKKNGKEKWLSHNKLVLET